MLTLFYLLVSFLFTYFWSFNLLEFFTLQLLQDFDEIAATSNFFGAFNFWLFVGCLAFVILAVTNFFQFWHLFFILVFTLTIYLPYALYSFIFFLTFWTFDWFDTFIENTLNIVDFVRYFLIGISFFSISLVFSSFSPNLFWFFVAVVWLLSGCLILPWQNAVMIAVFFLVIVYYYLYYRAVVNRKKLTKDYES